MSKIRWKYQKECPEWWLARCYGSGKSNWSKMCSAVAETFSKEQGSTPTHIHFYTKDLYAARRIYQTIKEDLEVETIKTFSIDRDEEDDE